MIKIILYENLGELMIIKNIRTLEASIVRSNNVIIQFTAAAACSVAILLHMEMTYQGLRSFHLVPNGHF